MFRFVLNVLFLHVGLLCHDTASLTDLASNIIPFSPTILALHTSTVIIMQLPSWSWPQKNGCENLKIGDQIHMSKLCYCNIESTKNENSISILGTFSPKSHKTAIRNKCSKLKLSWPEIPLLHPRILSINKIRPLMLLFDTRSQNTPCTKILSKTPLRIDPFNHTKNNK